MINFQRVAYGYFMALVILIACETARADTSSNNSATTKTIIATINNANNEPTRRAFPTPFNSLFPSTEYLGPIIGIPNADSPSPLTQALWDSFPELKEQNITVSGWINPSFNLSTSNNSNSPMTNNIVPNHVELEQAVLSFQRSPDTVQTKHTDWGFTFSNLIGIDYRTTIAQGIFSDQLLEQNNLYGYDPVEMYGELYVPNVAEGMVVTIGRYFTPSDIENTFAPDNYLFTHSVMGSQDASTQTGVTSAIKLNNQWTIMFGVNVGNDVAPWNEAVHIPTVLAMARWVSNDNNDSLFGGVNSFNNGAFTDNHENLQQFNLTWTHRFTPDFFIETEGYYMYQKDALQGGTCNFGPVEPYGGGGGCGVLLPGISSEIGFENFIVFKVSDKDFSTFRTGYLDDSEGMTTGYATQYMDFTWGITHAFTALFSVRPEIRYEFAFSATPYNDGTKQNQASIDIDAILQF